MGFSPAIRTIFTIFLVQAVLAGCGARNSSEHANLKGSDIPAYSDLLTIDFDKTLSLKDFIKILNAKSLDRVELPPIHNADADKNNPELFEFVADKSWNSRGDTIYYIYGHLEFLYLDHQWWSALSAINALRRIGWKVVIDTLTSKAEMQTYFADPRMRAFFWSSHGGKRDQGNSYLTTVESFSIQDTFYASEFVQRTDQNLSFGILCSCFSGEMLKDVASKLNMPADNLYGSNGTITIEECKELSGPKFEEYYNKHMK